MHLSDNKKIAIKTCSATILVAAVIIGTYVSYLPTEQERCEAFTKEEGMEHWTKYCEDMYGN